MAPQKKPYTASFIVVTMSNQNEPYDVPCWNRSIARCHTRLGRPKKNGSTSGVDEPFGVQPVQNCQPPTTTATNATRAVQTRSRRRQRRRRAAAVAALSAAANRSSPMGPALLAEVVVLM